MLSILEGLSHMHAKKIFHRDIKAANILISNDGGVKIADFGLARNITNPPYTNRVVTMWYRAPELLLGETYYDAKIDMWSVGCLFVEMLNLGNILFPGDGRELDQLNKIYDICGTPDLKAMRKEVEEEMANQKKQEQNKKPEDIADRAARDRAAAALAVKKRLLDFGLVERKSVLREHLTK